MPKKSSRLSLWGVIALVLLLGGTLGTRLAFGDSTNDSTSAKAQPAQAKQTLAKHQARAKPAKAASSSSHAPSAAQAALIARGKYLATAADCMPCHSTPGQKPFSGGLSLVTPFGTMYSANITPDERTGIGNWTDKQFWNALHNGIRPGRSLLVFPNYLYPGMPYTSYSKLSYQDVIAIKTYLDSLKPVDHRPPPNAMSFPFSIRAVLLGWRVLFFHPHPVHYAKNWSPAVRNGAYIAQALGHCGECHSPRNFLFAVKSGTALAGAPIPGETWFAPNISSSKEYGVGGWLQQDLVSYLHKGGNMAHGSAFGPMKSVVDYSLSQIPKSDVQDLAQYLQQATKPQDTPREGKITPADEKRGSAIYAANCAGCHQATGKGVANVFPNLAGNSAVFSGPPNNVIGAVLGGLGPWHPNGAPMPAFGSALDDHQIAALANYVRTAWGNKGAADATAAHVLAMRETAPPLPVALADPDFLNLPPIASAAARRFGCPLVSASDANLLSAPGSGWMSIMRDATPETLATRTRMLLAALRDSDPTMSPSKLTDYLMAAYCPVVANQSGMSIAAKQAALERFIAGAEPEISAHAGQKGG